MLLHMKTHYSLAPVTTRCWKNSSAIFSASHKFSEIEMCFRDSSILTKCWQDPDCQIYFLSGCLFVWKPFPRVTTFDRCCENCLWAADSRLLRSTLCTGQMICTLLQRMDKTLIHWHCEEEEKIIQDGINAQTLNCFSVHCACVTLASRWTT